MNAHTPQQPRSIRRVLLLIAALIVAGGFAITSIMHQVPPARIPTPLTTTATSPPEELPAAELRSVPHPLDGSESVRWLSATEVQGFLNPPHPLDGIESAERHNVYEMKRYWQRVSRSMRLETSPVASILRGDVRDFQR